MVSYDSFIKSAGCQSICGDQVKHALVLELADSRLRIAENVRWPWFIEEELLDTEDGPLVVDGITLDALLAEADKVASGYEQHALVNSTSSNHSLTRLEFDSAQGLYDETLITLFNTMQKGAHSGIFEKEIAQFTIHLAIGDVTDNRILLLAMNIEVESIHGVTRSYLHDFENLSNIK